MSSFVSYGSNAHEQAFRSPRPRALEDPTPVVSEANQPTQSLRLRIWKLSAAG